MANNILDVNATLSNARDRINAKKEEARLRVEEQYYTKPIIDPNNQIDITINPNRINEATVAEGSYGDKHGDLLPMIGGALQSSGSGLAHAGVTALTGLEMAARSIMGQDYDASKVLNDRVQAVNDYAGLDSNFYNDMYSTEHKQFLAEQGAIDTSDLSEADKFKAQAQLLWNNKGEAGIELGKTVLSSGVDLLLGARALKGLSGVSNAAKTGIATVPTSMGHYIAEEADKGDVTYQTVANAQFVGGFTGATTMIGGKLFKGEAESAIVNRVLGNAGANEVSPLTISTALKMAGKAGGEELHEELLQNFFEVTTHNRENNRNLAEGLGVSTVNSAVYGFHSGAIMSGGTSILPATANSSKQLANKAANIFESKLRPKVNIAEGLDINSPKYNPAEVYKQAQTNMANATTPDEVREHQEVLHRTRTETSDRYMELRIQAQQETDPVKKEAMLNKAKEFKDTYLSPLIAATKAHQNLGNKNDDDFVNNIVNLAQERKTQQQTTQASETKVNVSTNNNKGKGTPTVTGKPTSTPVSMNVQGKQYNALLKNDGNGEGDYFEVKTSKGTTKYYNFNEATKENLTPTKQLETDSLKFKLSRGHAVNSVMNTDLQNMATEFRKLTGKPLTVLAAFRSYKDQEDNLAGKQNFNQDSFVQNSWAGGSRHHTGLALDFQSTSNEYWKTPEGKKELQVLDTLSSKYGFEKSYPEGNKSNVGAEAWEFTYRGKDENTRALTGKMLTPKNTNVSVTPTNNTQPTTNTLQDTVVKANGHKELGFKTPFVSVGKGNSISNGTPVKANTLGFAKVLDNDPEMQSIMNAFTSFNGGTSHKGGEKSHYNGFKFDLDLKNGDDIATYEKAVNRVQALAKEHGYDIVVLAEGKGWNKLGKSNFIHGDGGSHLDVKVIGRGNGTQTINTGYIFKADNQLSSDQATKLRNARLAVASLPSMAKIAQSRNVPVEILTALIAQESGGRFDAQSDTGAIGLLQTTKVFRDTHGLSTQDSIKITDKAIQATVNHLADAYKEFGNWKDAIRSYNAGIKGNKDFLATGKVSNDPVRNKEVAEYADKVLGYLSSGTNAQNTQPNTNMPNNNDSRIKQLQSQIKSLTNDVNNNNESKINELQTQIDELKAQASTTPNTNTEQSTVEENEENTNIVKEVISRASTIKPANLVSLINTGLLSESQKQSLRIMLDIKQAIALSNDTSKVRQEIITGRQGNTTLDTNMGLRDYDVILSSAIQHNDTKTIDKYMGYLDNFTDSKVNKAKALQEALALNPSNNKPVAIVPDNKGNWSVVDNITVKGNKDLEKASAFQVWTGNTKTNNAILEEADFQSSFRDNYVSLLNSHMNNGLINPVTLNQVTPPTVTPTVNTPVTPSNPTVNSTPVNTPVTPVVTPTPVVVTPSINVPSNSNVPVETPVVKNETGIVQVKSYDPKTMANTWLDRGIDAEGNPVSMSMHTNPKNKDKDLVGSHGWLANPFQVNASKADDTKGFIVSSKEVATAKYVKSFKDLFNQTNKNGKKIPNFAKAVIALKDKPLYTRNSKDETVQFVNEVTKQIPTDINEARKWVDNITGFKDGKITFKEQVKEVKENKTDNKVEAKVENKVEAKVDNEIENKVDNKVETKEANPTMSAEEALDDYYNNREDDEFIGYEPTDDYYNNNESTEDNITEPEDIDEVVSHGGVEVLTSRLNKNISAEEYLTNEEINTGTSDEKLVKNLTSILLAYLPNQLIRLDTGAKEHSSEGNLITLANTDTALKYLSEQVLKNALGNLPNLSIESEEGTELYKLSKAIVLIKYNLAISLNKDSLSEAQKKVVINLISLDNNELLQSVLIDEVREVLRKISVSDTKVKTNVFKRMVKAIGSYFGMSSAKVQTGLEKVINTIGLATQMNNKLNDLDFTKSVSGQLSIIQDNINYPDYTKYSPKRLEKEGVFFIPPPNKRNMTKAKARNISQSKLKEFLDEIKTLPKTEQGLEQALKYWEDLVNQLQSNNYQISNDAIKQVQTGLAYTFSNATTRMSREYEKDLYARNLVTASFTQNKNNPLASISNFVQKLSINLMQGVNAVTDVIPNLNQRNQLKNFIEFNEMFSKHLRDTFELSSNSTFQFKDLKGFLSQGEKQLDNNLLSAISLEVYNWIIENGNNTHNTHDDISHILGLEPDDVNNFHSDTYTDFAHIGTPDRFIYSKLGKAIYNTLGLQLDENANYEFDVRLQSSLGDWALNALRETGLIQEHQKSMKEILEHKRMYTDDLQYQSYYASTDEASAKETIIYEKDMTAQEYEKYKDKIIDPTDQFKSVMGNYISVVDLNGENQNKELVNIVDKSKGTQGFLQQLFNSTGGLRQPLLEKPTNSNVKIKRADVVMNRKQRSHWDKVQEQSFRVNTKIYNLFTGLHSKNADSFLGMINAKVSESVLKSKLEIRQKAEQSKANGRLKEFTYMVDFVSGLNKEGDEYQPFWDTISGSVNLRTIYDSNVVNIQSNKVQRAVIELSNSESEVNKKEPMYGKKGITVHGRFFQALAEKAEGTEDNIKAILNAADSKLKDVYSRGYTFDKIQGEHFIPAFIEYLKTDKDVLKGVSAMTVALNNPADLTQEQINDIATVVSNWDMGAESLRALAEYTMYLNAKDTYSTYITLGSDGINNGIALSHMLTGNVTEDSAHMFGLIHKELSNQFNTYQETRVDSTLSDYYEGFAPYVDAIKERASKSEIGKVIVNLGVSLSGRKAAKVIIIPFGYGAMANRLTAVSFDKFKEDIYDLVESIYSDYQTNPETALEDWKKLNEDLKIIVRTNKDVLPDIGIALQFGFSNKEEIALYTSYREYVGDDLVNEGLATYASSLTKVRDLNIDMHGKTSILYMEYRKAYIESKEQELVEKLLPKVQEHVNNNPKYANLTKEERSVKALSLAKSQAKLVGFSKLEMQEIEKELEVIKPRLQTVWTFDIDNLFNRDESGIDLYNISTGVKNDNITIGITRKSDGSTKQNALVVSQKEVESIGVKASALQTQSIDGYIAAIANSLSTIGLNIHDALNTGLESFKELTALQNRATFTATVNYHQQTANLATLLNTVREFSSKFDLEKYPDITKQLLKSKDQEIDVIARQGKEDGLKVNELLHTMLSVMIDKGIDSDIRKLNQWKDINTVQQYGGENGEIKLSKEDFKLLDKQIKLLEKTREELHKVNNDTFKLNNYKKSDTPRSSKLTQRKGLPDGLYKKDQAKADKANKYIGFGKSGSATHLYRQDFGNMANTSNYAETNIVFVSANGDPTNKYRYSPLFSTFKKELDLAIQAGVTFITDNSYDRNREYNIGERELAEYLSSKGYADNNGNGVWVKQEQGKTDESRQSDTTTKRDNESGTSDTRTGSNSSINTSDNDGGGNGNVTTENKTQSVQREQQLTKEYDIDSIAKAITKLDTTEAAKVLFNELSKLVKEYNPNLTFITDIIADEHHAEYNNLNQIVLNNKVFKTNEIKVSPEDKLRAINHELFHALTETGLSKDTQAVKDLTAIYEQIKSKANGKFTNELEDINEFVAYGTTDPAFAAFIADNLNLKEAGIKTLGSITDKFKAFLTVVYNVLGFKDNKAYKTFLGTVNKTIETYDSANTVFTVGVAGTKSRKSTISSNTFEQLDTGNVSTEFNNHLDVLNEKLIKPFSENLATTEVQAIIDTLSTKATNAGFDLSDKEIASYEIIKAMVETYEETQTGNTPFNELHAIYTELFNDANFNSTIFLADVATATKKEKQIAKNKYDFIFANKGKNKDGEYLSRFIGLALASEEVNAIISKPRTKTKSPTEDTLLNKLMDILTNILDFFSNKLLKRISGNIDKQLLTLMVKIKTIDIKASNTAPNILESIWNYKDTINGYVNTFVKSAIVKGIEATKLQSADNDFVRTTAKVIRSALTTDMSESLRINAELVEDKVNPSSKLGVIGETFNELAKATPIQNIIEKFIRLTNHVGQTRQALKTDSNKALLSKFNTANLTKENRASLSTVLLRTDLSSLMNNGLNITQVLSMITDKEKRKSKIDELVTKISKLPNGIDMLMNVKSLASYMVLENSPKHLVKNSKAITIGLGTNYQIDLKDIDTKLLKDIDTLVSLYALEYTPNKDMQEVTKLIDTDLDGIKAVLKFHQQVTKLAEEDFTGNPYNYMKGYLPDITNPKIQTKFVLDENEVKEAEKEGWVRVSDVDLLKDTSDTTQTNRILMVNKDYDYTPIISGAVDLKDTSSRGTEVYNRDDYVNITRVTKEKLADRLQRNRQDFEDYDPRESNGNLIASYATDGSIMDYSYEMQGFVKNKVLERNNDVFTLLPTLYANVQFKPQINELQRELPEVLYKDYKESYLKNPKQFILLDPESNDPEIVAQWVMLPYEFREAATKLYGKGNPIAIRRNIYNATFGFKQYSIFKMFDKTSGEKNFFEKFLTLVLGLGTVGYLTGDKAKTRAVKMERVIQALVGYAKETIVIRSGKVLLGNIISNALMLMMLGVNPVRMTKDMNFAFNEGRKYNQYKSEINQINVELSIARGKSAETAKLKQRRMHLENRMKKSKLHRYMEAGMMSTIVEDVDSLTSDTTYTNGLQDKLKTVGEKVPEPIKIVSNFVLMGKSSSIFQFLAEATQFSDFGAKYSMAEHLIATKGYSFERAVTEAQNTFINFDVPTNVGLDYLNKMGIFMFTKFFLRFQKVLTKLIRDKPASLISQHLMAENMLGVAGVLDPFMPLHLGNNPFHSSGLMVLNADETMLVPNMISGLW